jgi:hypothetical protein
MKLCARLYNKHNSLIKVRRFETGDKIIIEGYCEYIVIKRIK